MGHRCCLEDRHHFKRDMQSFDGTIENARCIKIAYVYNHVCDKTNRFRKANTRRRRVNADGSKWTK